ncbi:MAG: hydrogenase small subunit [Thiobacillus sp.]
MKSINEAGLVVSRRAFLKFCSVTASLLALPPGAAALMGKALPHAPRLPVVWLSFQECTGCTESLTRSSAPTMEQLLFDLLSLDYHHTLQAASGEAAEAAREATLKAHAGKLVVVVDGSVPTALDGVFSTIAGETNLSLLRRCIAVAESVIAVGTCAGFGGLPAAAPNPTGAMGIGELMDRGLVPRRPLVNLPGCPPIPEVMSAVLAHRVAFGSFPPLDELGRPLAFYGETVHDRCSRRGHYEAGRFAKTFDDAGARAGWCLLELGCKGPATRNACSTVRWNGVGNPVESGHPCLDCSEPGFWDRGSFYARLGAATAPPPAADSELRRGEAVYAQRCADCHGSQPSKLQTAPEQIPELLRAGTVRAHRFSLDEADLQSLVDYLKTTR